MKVSVNLLMGMVLISILSCSKSTYQARISSGDGAVPSTEQFMSDAMYNGLMRDGFPKDMLASLLEKDIFIGKCPICRPTEAGMREYLAEDDETEVPVQVPAHVLTGLQGEGEVLKNAFRDLTARYVAWHHEALNLSPAQSTQLKKQLHADRKRGMSAKPVSFGKFCPSCDGACEIK